MSEYFNEGEIVRIRISGEKGMIKQRIGNGYSTPEKYLVRVPDYREIVFERMEIEQLKQEADNAVRNKG